QPGSYRLSVYASSSPSRSYLDASYVFRVRALLPAQLSFGPELNSGGVTNIVSGTLADNEHAYYQVTVPTSVAGAPVLGWKLDLAAVAGSPSVPGRPHPLPDNTDDR